MLKELNNLLNPILAGRAPGKSYNTQLDPITEIMFRNWIVNNKVPFDPNAGMTDYDMRGFYQGLQQGNPKAVTGIDPNDNQLHYTDYWKTPLHSTFSNESQWAPPDALHWEGDELKETK